MPQAGGLGAPCRPAPATVSVAERSRQVERGRRRHSPAARPAEAGNLHACVTAPDEPAFRYLRNRRLNVDRSGRGRSGALGGPGEVRRPQAGAYGVAPVVGQTDAADKAVAWAHGVGDEVGRDVDEAELGAAK